MGDVKFQLAKHVSLFSTVGSSERSEVLTIAGRLRLELENLHRIDTLNMVEVVIIHFMQVSASYLTGKTTAIRASFISSSLVPFAAPATRGSSALRGSSPFPHL